MNRREFAIGATAMAAMSGCGKAGDDATSGAPEGANSAATKGASSLATIRSGDTVLVLNPALGGSIARLDMQGHHIYRPTNQGEQDILGTSCFPIVPVVNRIPNGKINFDGKDIQLTPNLLDLADFFHGQGWRSSWQVTKAGDDGVGEMVFDHPAGEWPWAYQARQRFDVTSDSFRHTISVENKSDSPMPAGLGFHPYFPKTAATRLQANYVGYWKTNESLHPREKSPGNYRKDWIAGDDLIDEEVTDYTFYGFDGNAVISEEGRPTLNVTSHADCDNMHVYSPPGDFFCMEPVTDRADPFREEPRQIKILAPGESYSIWMQIDLTS